MPTTHTVAVRTPPDTGIASGSSTIRSCCRGVMPTPRAASVRAGSTPRMPITVLRSTGRMPYSVSPHDGGQEPDALEIEGREHGNHDRQQRQAGDGLDDPGERQRRLLEPRETRRRDAQRHADADAQEQREQRELQVCRQVTRKQCQQLAHVAASEPSSARASMMAAWRRGVLMSRAT